MRYEKVYVDVIVRFTREGRLKPIEIIWTSGERFKIDKTKYVDRAPSHVGGLLTWRYTVDMGGRERKLYYEKDSERWFVERRI